MNDSDPNEPPNTKVATEAQEQCRVRRVFCFHLVAVIAGWLLVSNDSILDDRSVQSLIAFPLYLTLFVCPVAMLFAVAVARTTSMPFRLFALIADLVLSIVQVFVWLPTVM